MKLFFDRRLGYLVTAPGQDAPLTELTGKRGDGQEVQIQFGRSSDPTSSSVILSAPVWTAEQLAGGSVIKIGIKLTGEYGDGALLAGTSTFTYDPTDEVYEGTLDLNTSELTDALLAIDADEANDLDSLDCGFEVTYQLGGSGPWSSSLNEITYTVLNDIIAGDEATPVNAGDPDEYPLKSEVLLYYGDISSLTGGTGADLDSVPTVSLAVGTAVGFLDTDPATDVVRFYKLTAGTDAESSPDVIRPDDYAATTNEKVWKLQAFAPLGLNDVVDDTSPELGGTLNTNAKQVRFSKGADVASASTLTLGVDGNYFDVTGATTITSIATLAAGTTVKLHFDAALTLTHHATDLILPGGANITTAAGDEAEFTEYATGDWRCTSYTKATGRALVESTVSTVQTNIWIPASDMISQVTNGAASASVETASNDWNYAVFDFDTATTEYVNFMRAMPDNWKLGTITARFYWTATSGSGTVAWGLQGLAFIDGLALDTTPGSAVTVTDTLTTALDMHITDETSAITIGGSPAAGVPVMFKIFRSVGLDTLGVDARLLGCEINYTALTP